MGANTLGFAPAAAARGDFTATLKRLGVLEVVDRCSPPGAETAGFREPVG